MRPGRWSPWLFPDTTSLITTRTLPESHIGIGHLVHQGHQSGFQMSKARRYCVILQPISIFHQAWDLVTNEARKVERLALSWIPRALQDLYQSHIMSPVSIYQIPRAIRVGGMGPRQGRVVNIATSSHIGPSFVWS